MTADSKKLTLVMLAGLAAASISTLAAARAPAGQLFSDEQELRLQQYGNGKNWSANWEGIIPSTGAQNTRVRRFRLEEGAFVFDKTPIYRSNFVRYRNEGSMEPRLAPKLFMLKGYACVEGGAKSESSFATRHNHVHLVVEPYGDHPIVYKLPSLFASCKQIRRERDGRILFDQGTYEFDKANLSHRSVRFNEIALEDGGFNPTGKTRVLQLLGDADDLKLEPEAQ